MSFVVADSKPAPVGTQGKAVGRQKTGLDSYLVSGQAEWPAEINPVFADQVSLDIANKQVDPVARSTEEQHRTRLPEVTANARAGQNAKWFQRYAAAVHCQRGKTKKRYVSAPVGYHDCIIVNELEPVGRSHHIRDEFDMASQRNSRHRCLRVNFNSAQEADILVETDNGEAPVVRRKADILGASDGG